MLNYTDSVVDEDDIEDKTVSDKKMGVHITESKSS
jgi:hypothetical protein